MFYSDTVIAKSKESKNILNKIDYFDAVAKITDLCYPILVTLLGNLNSAKSSNFHILYSLEIMEKHSYLLSGDEIDKMYSDDIINSAVEEMKRRAKNIRKAYLYRNPAIKLEKGTQEDDGDLILTVSRS
jgi:hypothetical protein